MEEVKQTLIELGLTELQAKVLIALQMFDYAEVKNISQTADVHRQQVYTALVDLQKIGLVEKLFGNPNKYNSLSLDQVFTILLERKNKWVSDMKKKTAILKDSLPKTMKTKEEQADYVFELITGKERIKNALYKWGKNTQTIDSVIKFDPLNYYISEELETKKMKLGKNLKTRIVTDANPKSVHLQVSENLKIRFIDFNFPVEMAIYDSTRAHFAMYSSRDDIPPKYVAVLTSNHPCFVGMLKNYFEVLWKVGKEINPKNFQTI